MNSNNHENEAILPYRQQEGNDDYITKASAISSLVQQNQATISQALNLASQITDVYRESQRLTAQVEIVKEQSKVELAKTIAKFQTTKAVIENVFAERKQALDAHYKVLDMAIENGNEAMILNAMREISSVVVSSPLSQIQDFITAYETPGQPLLDF